MYKKLLFTLLLLLVFAQLVQGQGYTSFFAGNDSLTWYYSDCFEGCYNAPTVARPDTAFPNPFIKANYVLGNQAGTYGLQGYFREDTAARKVYYRAAAVTGNDTAEFLLYDFSLAVGDSMLVTALQFGVSPNLIGWSTLDSIGTVDSLPGMPRVFYFTHVNYGQIPVFTFYFRWVEGIGRLETQYTYDPNNISSYTDFLHCFYRDTAHIYKRDLGYSIYTETGDTDCIIHTLGIHDVTPAITINLFPNPAAGELHVETAQAGNELQQVQLLNIYGATVSLQQLSGSTGTIPVSALPDGYYTAVISTKRGRSVQSLLKQSR